MKSHVAVYKTHEEAIHAIEALSEKAFPMDHVYLVGKADIIDDRIKIISVDNLKFTILLSFIGLGIVFGILSGLGVIPTFEFLTNSNIIISTFIGLDFGLIVGGIAAIVTSGLVSKSVFVRFRERAVGKKYAVMVDGPLKEIEKAETILHTEGIHNYAML